MSIACQIMTSYRLVEDYSIAEGSRPITIQVSENISEVHHLTKMMTYDLDRIQGLQGNVTFRYWKMLITHGITGIFGYYESLKLVARKEKAAAEDALLKE